MNSLIIGLSRYLIAIFAAFYALHCFAAFSYKGTEGRRWFHITQIVLIAFIHLIGMTDIAIQTGESYILILCVLHELIFILTIIMYRIIYPESSWLLVNNTCFFLSVGLIMLSRLSPEKALKQFLIAVVSLIISFFIPYIIRKFKSFGDFYLFYGIAGFAVLAAIYTFGSLTNGSKLSVSILGIIFQPSEFVKILFVLFEAGLLSKKDEGSIKKVVISALSAFVYCVILVMSRDLGAALIFFIAYIFMLYISRKAPLVLFGGLTAGIVGTVIGYRLFSHVRVRFRAWKDPFSEIEGQGYQITQSLFAIGTGGWFGMGLTSGSPDKIPVVEKDFIFSAISEEMGCIFSICLILVAVSTFLMFMNIAMSMESVYFRLIATGLAVIYAFQVFLTIGGVVKFIPLTGVTLPLVSYGGSSLLATLIMFALMQGIYYTENAE